MLTVVTMKWSDPGNGRHYKAEHVEGLRRMFEKHLTVPHRFVCVSDDPDVSGYHPIWEAPDVKGRFSLRNYVKLGLFGAPGKLVGDMLLYCDLDTVIRRNIDDLVTDDELKVFRYKQRPYLQGALIQLHSGCAPWVWHSAHNQSVIDEAEQLHHGTDQAVMSSWFYQWVINGQIPCWTEADGITIGDQLTDWRVYCATAWPKPWDRESPVVNTYRSEANESAID